MGGSEELKLLLVRKFEPRRVKDDDGRTGGDAAEQADEDVARPWRIFINFLATLFTLWQSLVRWFILSLLSRPQLITLEAQFTHRPKPGPNVINLFTAVI
jgi:hypothetical protein